MLRRTALTIVLVCALASPAWTEAGPESDAKATPTGVHQVFSGGFWSDGTTDGHYRIVVVMDGFEHISHRLFIQWIAVDTDNHDLKLVRTVAVSEVNDLSGLITDLKPQFQLNKPAQFTLTVEGRDRKKRRHTITATPDGTYTIR